ncbi:hypothetical protein B0H16DRAFT_1727225 [Mycena metata]|uniref:Uncharacterized protein n=1 Tax=Mycena metata TaxID=1033252 RepID=A0AAD7N504_9AGAR|nr:hypothetical protein B0H16DRAFT_1727225 [Mycena metata]
MPQPLPNPSIFQRPRGHRQHTSDTNSSPTPGLRSPGRRFIGHLTTPGTGIVSAARSFHAVNPSIQQRLSFTARTTLARPLAPQFLPRGPVVPRTMTQATSLSPAAPSARPTGTWTRRRKELLKPTATKKAQVTLSAPAEESAAELNRYFAAPTARAPLPEFPSGRLPLPALLAMHKEHGTHDLRDSSLFHCLDTADVWSRGAYAPRTPRARTPAAGMLGESGTGWCVLEETAADAYDADGEDADVVLRDVSFVLSTLDFSSSFLAAPGASTRTLAHSDLGAWSDSDHDSSIAFIDPPSENGWFERRWDSSNANPWLERQ